MLTKFLIIPEKDERNFYHLLPLIINLREDYPEAEINIVHSYDLDGQFKGLFPKVRFYKFDESQLGPVASLKLAEQLVDIFNIDFLLNYRSDVGALHLGKAFGAKRRLGLKSLVNDIFLTDSFKIDLPSVTHRYLDLWAKFLKKSVESKSIGFDKEVSPENFFKASEVEPFFFFSFHLNEENTELVNFLITLFGQLKDTKKVFWLQEENAFTEEFLKAELPKTVNASEVPASELYNYLLHCNGMITNINWVASMASYLQVESILLNGDGQKVPETHSYKISPTVVETSIEGRFQLDLGDEKKPLDSEAFIEEIFNWFKI